MAVVHTWLVEFYSRPPTTVIIPTQCHEDSFDGGVRSRDGEKSDNIRVGVTSNEIYSKG